MRIVSAVCVIASLCVAAPAAADDDKERAQVLVNEGYERAQRGDHLGALGKFREAYTLYQSPNLHIYIGTALWNLGRYAEARASYVAYLEHPDATDDKRAQVEAFLAELGEHIGILVIEVGPDGAALQVDGVEVEPGEVHVDPGRHSVIASRDGYVTETRTIEAIAGARTEVAIALRKVPPRTVITPPATTESAVIERGDPGPPRGRIGGTLGVVIDPLGPGAAAVVGGSFAITRRLEVSVAGIAGGEQGIYAGGRLYLSDARLRPALAAGTPIFASDGLAVGVRGAAAVEWLVSGALSITAELGVEYYPDVPADRVTTLFAPSVGIVARN